MPFSRSFIFFPAVVLLGALQHASAQTTTNCNPLNATCAADPAFGTDHNFIFNSTPPEGTWNTTAGTVEYDSIKGATFTINKQGDSPTIRSAFYIFFGRVEIWMKAASGQGIISSMMLLSDDLDEIDWEFLGGNGTHAETNYFGKGVSDYHNAIYYPVTGGTLDEYHNYTIDWTNSSLDYYIDGAHVRTLLPADANSTKSYPQTPMRLSLGIWAGGDPSLAEGTIQWAGGKTDFSKAPFTMYVQSTRITDYSRGTAYNYTDRTGTWQSIHEIEPAKNSSAVEAINAGPSLSLSQKFNNLPTAAKTAIYAFSVGAAALLVVAGVFYFIRQRKQGAREAALAAQRDEEERLELERYKAAGINPDGFSETQPEYDSKTGIATRDVEVPSYSAPNSPGYTNEKFSSDTGMGAAAGAGAIGAAAASRPLLGHGSGSGSPPGSPHNVQTPYHDGFSPLDSNQGYGNIPNQSPGIPPSGPLPGPPSIANHSFSTPNPVMRMDIPVSGSGGYGNVDRVASPGPTGGQQPQRSLTNPNQQPGTGGDYWR